LRTLRRVFLGIFGTAIAVAFASIFALGLIAHFLLGAGSPGLVELAKQGMQNWIPMWMGMLMLWAIWTFCRILIVSRREAKVTGIPWLTYLDLPRAEKRKLLGLADEQ
jgi:hypothetical protein